MHSIVPLLSQKIKPFVQKPGPLIVGVLAFFSTAHHLFNFWEQALWGMVVIFGIGAPLFVGAAVWLWHRLAGQLGFMSKTHWWIFISAAALAGTFIAWRIYRVPVSYHMLTITPQVSSGQTVEVIEVKANSGFIDIEKPALQQQWKKTNAGLQATRRAQPFSVSFRTKANAPVTVLLAVSSQSGSVRLTLDGKMVEAQLAEAEAGTRVIEMQATYRQLPNWLFIPGLVLADVITLSALILFLLLIQAQGEHEADELNPNAASQRSTQRKQLLMLMLLGVGLHILNALATPLFIGPDSSDYLTGAVHWLRFGNLDGVSDIRGPGTTFLFAPIMLVFGRNPWGIKLLLHFLALACIPVSYRLGWQVSRNERIALISGLLAALSPDLMFYSNYVMSDAPNMLVVLMFSMLLLSALEHLDLKWILAVMLTGSFAVLLRPENIVMLGIGFIFLLARSVWIWRQTHAKQTKQLTYMGVAFGVALLPILWWSAHNLRVYGFFGMSNYEGEVFYDGWVYTGDASHLSFSDPASPAIKLIHDTVAKYPAVITDKSGVATGWEIYPSLRQAGYSPAQAFDLLQAAAWDSIKHHPELALKLLFIKYRAGLMPEITFNITYPLPGEPPRRDADQAIFFDAEAAPNLPWLIQLQRAVNSGLMEGYPALYPYWILLCIALVFLSLFRSPWYAWSTLTALTLSRIFIPLTIGVAFWRYALAGWLPAEIIAVSGLWLLWRGSSILFGKRVEPS